MHSSRMRTVRSSSRLSGEGRGVCSWGVSAPSGVSALGGCLLRGWVFAPGVLAPGRVSAPGGGVCSRGCLLKGGLLPGGVCSRGGVSAPRGCLLRGAPALGGMVSQHALRQTPPPSCGQTDACKNVTFATSLRTVITTRITSLY